MFKVDPRYHCRTFCGSITSRLLAYFYFASVLLLLCLFFLCWDLLITSWFDKFHLTFFLSPSSSRRKHQLSDVNLFSLNLKTVKHYYHANGFISFLSKFSVTSVMCQTPLPRIVLENIFTRIYIVIGHQSFKGKMAAYGSGLASLQ